MRSWTKVLYLSWVLISVVMLYIILARSFLCFRKGFDLLAIPVALVLQLVVSQVYVPVVLVEGADTIVVEVEADDANSLILDACASRSSISALEVVFRQSSRTPVRFIESSGDVPFSTVRKLLVAIPKSE